MKLGQGMSAEQAVGSAAGPAAEPIEEPVSFTISVPATSANLGPGYDSMGLALSFYDEIRVTASPRKDSQRPDVTVKVSGQGAQTLPRDASHLVIALIERILASKGYLLPDLEVAAQNRIPHSRGLGSSAAAVAAAVVTADTLLPEGLNEDEKLQLGSRIEGHPDNYVPALRGGVAVSWESRGMFRTSALPPHSELRTVAAVPGFEQSTEAARGLLPAQVPHADAARNSSRSALLVHALTAAPELLLEATEDMLHQQYRRSAFPSSMALLDSLRDAGYAAVISGAGPAVLILTAGDSAAEEAASHVSTWAAQHAESDTWSPMILPISRRGATVEKYQR